MTGSDIPMEQHPFYHPLYLIRHAKNKPICVEEWERFFTSALRTEHHMVCFSSGKSNFLYLPAFNASLFLSANPDDTRNDIHAGIAAGKVIGSEMVNDENDQ